MYTCDTCRYDRSDQGRNSCYMGVSMDNRHPKGKFECSKWIQQLIEGEYLISKGNVSGFIYMDIGKQIEEGVYKVTLEKTGKPE